MYLHKAFGGLLLALASVGLAASCGSSSEDPCTTVYRGKCGSACLTDAACPVGMYCTESGCRADCTQGGDECGFDVACSPQGRCGKDPGNGFTTGGTSSNGCEDINVTFDRVIPTVVLLVDQSGSMTDDFGGDSRWNVLHDALTDPSGFVATLENDVRFGLALYTSHDGSGGGTCPILTEVNIALANYASIKNLLDNSKPDDETPTGDSIDKVVAKLAPFTEPGPKVIVLATDGEPDTCEEPNPQNGQQEAIAAAQAAFNNGIKTFIISVGADVSLGHMQDMANAGVGQPIGGSSNAPYYQALDPTSLIQAFNAIINGVRPCTFTLNGEVKDPTKGKVVLDGQEIGYGDPNGWKLNGASELELVGDACAKIQEGEHSLTVTFPCGAVIVDPK